MKKNNFNIYNNGNIAIIRVDSIWTKYDLDVFKNIGVN